MAQPSVSVVIPAHNEGPRLHLTLEALRDTTTYPHEVIVVDDGSTDGAITYLEDHLCLFENVRLVRQARAGPAGARNRGAAEARGDVLVFLDAQSFPRRGWLERMLAALEQYPDAMVMPTIAAAGALAYTGYGLQFRDDLSLVSLTERPSGLSEVPLAPGCCLALSSRLFHHVGGFDQMYGFEDVELSLRWWLCGYRVLIEPSAVVAHLVKRHRLDDVALEGQIYSLLRMAGVHLDPNTRERMLARFRGYDAYRRALARLQGDNFGDWVDFVSRRKRRRFSWFANRFGLSR